MNEVEFIYEGKPTIIQCNLEDKMKDICNRFLSKTGLSINNIYFLYNGNIINVESQFSSINQGNNRIKILVNDIKPEIKTLKFKINDYIIIINFTETFDIKVELNKKIYDGSFSLEVLKNKSKIFKMFDSIQDTYNDIKLLLEQNSFYIQTYEKSIALCIKKQIGIQYDIVFPLKEGSIDIKEIVTELCEKNIILEKKIIILENKINEINETNKKLEKKIYDLEKTIKEIVSKEKDNFSKAGLKILESRIIKRSDEIDFVINRLKQAFNNKNFKFNLLYRASKDGDALSIFHSKCDYKTKVLVLYHTTEDIKFGGYSEKGFDCSGVYKNDVNSFLFSIDKRKIYNSSNGSQLFCHKGNGPSFGNNRAIYLQDNIPILSKEKKKHQTTQSTQSFQGFSDYEINNGNCYFSLQELEIFQIVLN